MTPRHGDGLSFSTNVNAHTTYHAPGEWDICSNKLHETTQDATTWGGAIFHNITQDTMHLESGAIFHNTRSTFRDFAHKAPSYTEGQGSGTFRDFAHKAPSYGRTGNSQQNV